MVTVLDALNCPFWHSYEEISIFHDEKKLRERELQVRCGFCVRGECRYGDRCERPGRCATCSEEQQEHHDDSDYASAESGDDSAADECEADDAGCAAEGRGEDVVAGSGWESGHFLSKDWSEAIKGWSVFPSKVGNVGQRGIGEASVYLMLDYVKLPVPPALLDCNDVSDQCEVDAVGFVFQKSERAAMS